MYVRVSDGQVEQVRLEIYEPPRFFEAFLRGRSYTEPPDITARICGICPAAYQTSACWAIESACGVALAARAAPAQAAVLRRVDLQPCPAHLHAARARFPRLSGRRGDGTRSPRDRRARARPAPDGQRDHGHDRRPLCAPGQRPGGRFLPGSGRRRARPLAERLRTTLDRGRDGPLGGRLRLPRLQLRARADVAARAWALPDRAWHAW